MEDKTYIQALMEAPAREEYNFSKNDLLQQAVSSMREIAKAFMDIINRCIVQPLLRWWRSPATQRFFQALVRAAKRHQLIPTIPVHPRRRSIKRAHIYQIKMAHV